MEVKHSHTAFKANISGDHYDFLVFVYAPSDIVDGRIVSTAPRQVFVFPQHIVEATDKGKTGVNFNPKNVDGWEGYENNYSQILEHILGTTDVELAKDIGLDHIEPKLPMKASMTREPGIYIVTLNNEEPISINSQDPRYADKVYMANCKNVKVGKAKSLRSRMHNYIQTFGKENVNFLPLVITKEINEAEKAVMKELDRFRVRNPVSNRKTEWLFGITKDQAIEIVITNILRSDINHSMIYREVEGSE